MTIAVAVAIAIAVAVAVAVAIAVAVDGTLSAVAGGPEQGKQDRESSRRRFHVHDFDGL